MGGELGGEGSCGGARVESEESEGSGEAFAPVGEIESEPAAEGSRESFSGGF